MQLVPRNRVTKGKLGGKSFVYNPTSFHQSMQITYTDVKTAGLSYPTLQFAGGERRVITFDLYVTDKVKNGAVKEWEKHLNSFLPAKGLFYSPKTVTFAFGWYVQDCYLVQVETDYLAFSPSLEPIEATFSITLGII